MSVGEPSLGGHTVIDSLSFPYSVLPILTICRGALVMPTKRYNGRDGVVDALSRNCGRIE